MYKTKLKYTGKKRGTVIYEVQTVILPHLSLKLKERTIYIMINVNVYA